MYTIPWVRSSHLETIKHDGKKVGPADRAASQPPPQHVGARRSTVVSPPESRLRENGKWNKNNGSADSPRLFQDQVKLLANWQPGVTANARWGGLGGVEGFIFGGKDSCDVACLGPRRETRSKLRLDEHVVLFIPRQMRQIFCFCFALFCGYLHKVVSGTPLSQESRMPGRVQLHVNLNTPKTAIIPSSFNLSPVLIILTRTPPDHVATNWWCVSA